MFGHPPADAAQKRRKRHLQEFLGWGGTLVGVSSGGPPQGRSAGSQRRVPRRTVFSERPRREGYGLPGRVGFNRVSHPPSKEINDLGSTP